VRDVNLERLTALYEEHIAELTRRYAAALSKAGFDAVAIHSGSLKKRSDFDDQYWPLRATPHFQHWAPLAEPDCALVFTPGARPVLARPTATSFWEKAAPPETDHWEASFEIVRVGDPADVKRHFPSGASGHRLAFVGEELARASSWGIAEAQRNPAALVRALDATRTTKTAYEVLCLEEANRRAARGHDAVRAAFESGGASELELHLRYLAATSQDDPETPYKNIVALGANASTLHHVSYEKSARARSAKDSAPESLLLDAGSSYQGYCSDITRTWVRGSGATASAFGALVQGVESFQQRLCAAIAIGEPYEALHDESHRQVAAVLRSVGVAKAARITVEEIVESGITRAFFPHGLGHSLGLQCHDVGCAETKPRADNPFLRNTSRIAEGQVFTIEPGIYFIDALLAPLREGPHAAAIDWELVSALAQLGGVRIEDDLVVVARGGGTAGTSARNLTREHLPSGGGSARA
jgi:Xaa-Pro dipeptidase